MSNILPFLLFAFVMVYIFGPSAGWLYCRKHYAPRRHGKECQKMIDLVYLALALAFFVITFAYVKGCAKLEGPK